MQVWSLAGSGCLVMDTAWPLPSPAVPALMSHWNAPYASHNMYRLLGDKSLEVGQWASAGAQLPPHRA
jgi:hypothetical protein